MISLRTEWLLCGALLVAGVGWGTAAGAADSPPVAADVAGMAGCGAVERHSHDAEALETITCRTAGHAATVSTFADNHRRDKWVSVVQAQVVLSGMVGRGDDGLVYGDRWAMRTGDRAAIDRLFAAANGWRV